LPVVKTKRGACGSMASCFASETPSLPGRLTSTNTASGRSSAQRRRPASLSAAVPTTSTWQVSSSSAARYWAAKGSSSIIIARIRIHIRTGLSLVLVYSLLNPTGPARIASLTTHFERHQAQGIQETVYYFAELRGD